MRITATLPDHGAIITAVMEGFVCAAQLEIEAGIVPPSPLLVQSLKFIDEPAGQEDWLLPHQVMKAGGGDCEDLAFWHCAGLRATGQDPGATCVLMQTGVSRLHCVVQTSDGQIIDPTLDIRNRHPLRRKKVSGIGGDPVKIIDHRSDAIRKQAATEAPNSIDAWMYKQGIRTFDSRKDVPIRPGVEYGKNADDFLAAHGVKPTTLDDLIQRGVVNPDKMIAYQAAKGQYGGKDYASFGKSAQRLEWDDARGVFVDPKSNQTFDPSQVPGNNLGILQALASLGIDPAMLQQMGIDISQLQGMDPQTLSLFLQNLMGYGAFGGGPQDYYQGYPTFNQFGGYPGGMVQMPGMADLDELVDPQVFWQNAADLGLDGQSASDLGIDDAAAIDAEAVEVNDD